MKTFKHWKHLPIGKRSEAFLNYFLSPWFSGYWAFPNPKYKGKEICDSLLIWRDVVFLFQVTTRENIKSDVSWARNKIRKEKERILEWTHRLKTEESTILKNKYRKIIFPRKEIKWYYGLIVLNHVSNPYDANDFLEEDSSDPELAIQAISLIDIHNLMRYINTPWDFVNYFESRYRLSQKTSIKVHEEDKNFGRNLSHMFYEAKEGIGEAHAKKIDKFMDIIIKAVNGDLQKGDSDLRQYASSFLIDSAIGGILHKTPRDKHGNYVINDEFKLLIKAVEKLTEMSRLVRSFWGERFLNESEKALTSGKTEYVTGQSPSREMAYAFIVTDIQQEGRNELMKSVAREAMAKNNTREVIVIAASPERIFSSYQMFIGWFTRGKFEFLETNKMETLDSIVLYMSI